MTANTTAQCVNHRLIWSSKRNMLHHLLFFFFFYCFLFFLSVLSAVSQQQLILILAAAMAAMVQGVSHSLASERSSIESTYELTKYLEYQLKEIKDIYVSTSLRLRLLIGLKWKLTSLAKVFGHCGLPVTLGCFLNPLNTSQVSIC